MLQKYYRGVSKYVYDILTDDESWINNSGLNECFKKSQIQQNLLAHEVLPRKLTPVFFGKTGHVSETPPFVDQLSSKKSGTPTAEDESLF